MCASCSASSALPLLSVAAGGIYTGPRLKSKQASQRCAGLGSAQLDNVLSRVWLDTHTQDPHAWSSRRWGHNVDSATLHGVSLAPEESPRATLSGLRPGASR
jgi:hypothetical protein